MDVAVYKALHREISISTHKVQLLSMTISHYSLQHMRLYLRQLVLWHFTIGIAALQLKPVNTYTQEHCKYR